MAMKPTSRRINILTSPPKKPDEVYGKTLKKQFIRPPDGPPPPTNVKCIEKRIDVIQNEEFICDNSKIRPKENYNIELTNQEKNKERLLSKPPSKQIPKSSQRPTGTKRSFIRKPPPPFDSKIESGKFSNTKFFNNKLDTNVCEKSHPSPSSRKDVENAKLPAVSGVIESRDRSLVAWDSSRDILSNKIEQNLALKERLRPGRLTLRCCSLLVPESNDAQLKGFKAFVVITCKFLDKKFRTKSVDGRGHEISFEEYFDFDFGSFETFENDVWLKVEAWTTSTHCENLLGFEDISLLRFLTSEESWDSTIPLKGGINLLVNVEFTPAFTGLLSFRTNKLSCNLSQSMAKILLEVDSATVVKGKTFLLSNEVKEEFLKDELIIDVNESIWFSNLHVKIVSECEDSIYLSSTISMISLLKHGHKSKTITFQHGCVMTYDVEFFRAGNIYLSVKEGKILRGCGISMFLLKFSLEGGTSTQPSCTTFARKNDQDVIHWKEELKMYAVDQYKLIVECLHVVSKHEPRKDQPLELIGNGELSLLPAYKLGRVDTWLDLEFKNDFGSVIDAGQICLSLTFKAADGIAYPQRQVSMVSFDERQRVYDEGLALTDNTLHEKEINSRSPKTKDKTSSDDRDLTYSDDEIKAAFRFLDLDKNGYIGITELKHVLKCIGEEVEDDVVDMMVSMLDRNGDGQVSYGEFHEMVMSKDPSSDKFQRDQLVNNSSNKDNAPVDVKARDLKRRNLSSLVTKYKINKRKLTDAWSTVLCKPSWSLHFEMFCDLFAFDPTGEVHYTFKLFSEGCKGKVEARDILLSMSTFVEGFTNEEKCRFIFHMFDTDRSGFIDFSKFITILAANHMQNREEVTRKAQTIFNMFDVDGSGNISLQEMIDVSSKFPNLLLPHHENLMFTIDS